MTQIDPNPEEYLVARLTEALATDSRTNALDVEVLISRDTVSIRGTVTCHERRTAAETVIAELLPSGKRLANDLRVRTFREPHETELVD
jgi:predicted amino acid-binding ACT domain protein